MAEDQTRVFLGELRRLNRAVVTATLRVRTARAHLGRAEGDLAEAKRRLKTLMQDAPGGTAVTCDECGLPLGTNPAGRFCHAGNALTTG